MSFPIASSILKEEYDETLTAGLLVNTVKTLFYNTNHGRVLYIHLFVGGGGILGYNFIFTLIYLEKNILLFL